MTPSALCLLALLSASPSRSADRGDAESLRVRGDRFGYSKPADAAQSSDKTPAPEAPAGVPVGSPPLAILVHGIYSVEQDFDALEAELRRRGCVVARFHYDSRLSLERSADRFVPWARDQYEKSGAQKAVVLAHSMGGLVARRAMIAGRGKTLAGAFPIELITIAAPFGGFAGADHILIPWNVLGIKQSHRYLGASTEFILNPGKLGSNVKHIKIETNERGRTRISKGEAVSDSVALSKNQKNDAVDSDPQIFRRRIIGMGHVGVLGDRGRVPEELLKILDDRIQVPAPL